MAGTPHPGEFPAPSAAAAAASPAPRTPVSRSGLRWVTRSTLVIHGQTPAQKEPCIPQSTFSGDLAAATRALCPWPPNLETAAQIRMWADPI